MHANEGRKHCFVKWQHEGDLGKCGSYLTLGPSAPSLRRLLSIIPSSSCKSFQM